MQNQLRHFLLGFSWNQQIKLNIKRAFATSQPHSNNFILRPHWPLISRIIKKSLKKQSWSKNNFRSCTIIKVNAIIIKIMILNHIILFSVSTLEVMEVMHCFPGLWFMLIRPCSRVSRDINIIENRPCPTERLLQCWLFQLHFHLRECVLESAGMCMILQSCPRWYS